MAFDADQEILHDFLAEAGELLEALGPQLVALEQRPDDAELLNAAFRAFHTIKGGAGFVGLDPLVRLCHLAEDVFNLLRSRERILDADVVDLLFETLDVVGTQFDDAREGRAPVSAPAPLLEALCAWVNEAPGAVSTAPSPSPSPSPSPAHQVPVAAQGAISFAHPFPEPGSDTASCSASRRVPDDAEQAAPMVPADATALALDALPGAPSRSPPGGDDQIDDEIGDDEFEALLDALHGAGRAPGGALESPTASPVAAASAAPADDTVRVDVRRLDEIMNLVGELVLARNRLSSYQQTLRDAELGRIASNVDRVTADMQAAVMASRLQPVKRAFARFPRTVRDLARELGKDVRLEMLGVDTELDKNLVDALGEPLVHLVRNAVDHGVELPDVRIAAGKPREATITLAARHGGDHVLVTVAEDGAGMDPERIRQCALARGLISADEAGRMKDSDVRQLIFEPGFSTREAVSAVSGRGVGMDVVKTRIAQLNGTVEIESTPGSGSCFSIRLPLTLAIMPTLMVRIAGQRFALPLSNVIETYGLTPGRLQEVGEQPVMMVRGEILPLHHARAMLGHPSADVPEHVVAMLVDDGRIGLVVDELIGKEEVVIKPLGAFVRSLPGLAGATITGDGRIALILDAADLIRRTTVARRAEDIPCPII